MLKRLIAVLMLVAVMVALLGYRAATADAVQRNFVWHVGGWAKNEPPVRLVLISDIHVAGPDMPPARLAAIVERINALRPDCVLIAGDLISDRALSTRHIPFVEALAPLAGLRPRIATMAVLGNHDHWRSAPDAMTALRRYGVQTLSNEAARCGALAIGGVDHMDIGDPAITATADAVAAIGGVGVMFSHNPDVFPKTDAVRLTLAGHTHCGQVSIPFYGPPAIPSRFGRRYACGLIREDNRFLLVTAGLGTSVIPVRWGVPSDFWVVTVGP